MTKGTLYGVGVGPGDPQLITLKALRLLQRTPVIAYPAPERGESLTRQIVTSHLDTRGDTFEEIILRMPIEVSRFPAQEAYDYAEQILSDRLREGKDIAVLCEGDPFLYGSFMYLFVRMVQKFRVEVIAGVSSINACAAALGKPLCARDDRMSVLPAGLSELRLLESLQASETCVLIKVGRHLGRLRKMLRSLGLLESASYVEYATMGRQQILPLEKFEGDIAPYFSMVLVHRDGDARGLWREEV